ncbi:phosphonate C-P lyase system protein PhnG [Roseospirillum parvum]|uniref:Alpha-D-ribose 1-methylphosphonate 5-triphosphate synthase subunit PhnG n=1 Tax=Roseospirillum parvum TaxID=83401 RepID=A0A1G8ETM3_9PROT|nr:phosphonate C-P lyase system protein PhnG [Roseospirillum parvum]SDH73195.1 alpha-D-ribose 1-methylphosphonate 5-triphosphate synthase subunit PhnG [Roseospirillum parvum]
MSDQPPPDSTPRQRWMAALARAPRRRLAEAVAALDPLPEHTVLRPPEVGLGLVRGRMGGDGRPFNLGEMTLTRCTVRTSAGHLGHATIAGRDRAKAELAALLDALLQEPARQPALLSGLIAPLIAEQAAARTACQADTATTRVDFFTMVRGDE